MSAWRALAVNVHHHPADRGGRTPAIVHQIVPVGVAQLGRVLDEGGEQVAPVLRRAAGLDQAPVIGNGPVGQRLLRPCRGRRSQPAAGPPSPPPECWANRRCRRPCGRTGRTRARGAGSRAGSGGSRPGSFRCSRGSARRCPLRVSPGRCRAPSSPPPRRACSPRPPGPRRPLSRHGRATLPRGPWRHRRSRRRRRARRRRDGWSARGSVPPCGRCPGSRCGAPGSRSRPPRWRR